jgi:hypothetical protein
MTGDRHLRHLVVGNAWGIGVGRDRAARASATPCTGYRGGNRIPVPKAQGGGGQHLCGVRRARDPTHSTVGCTRSDQGSRRIGPDLCCRRHGKGRQRRVLRSGPVRPGTGRGGSGRRAEHRLGAGQSRGPVIRQTRTPSTTCTRSGTTRRWVSSPMASSVAFESSSTCEWSPGELQMADVRQQVSLSLVTEFENYS